MLGVVWLKVKPLPNSSAVLLLLPTLTLVLAVNVSVLTSVRPVRVLASLTFKPLALSATTPILPSVNSLAVVLPPWIFKVSPSFLLTLSPVSPSKVSGDCAKPCKSLMVAAEFGLVLLAFPKRVTKFGCPLFPASAMADLTLVISLSPALMPLLVISTVPTFSFSLVKCGLLSSSMPSLLAKPILSLVMRAVFSMPAPDVLPLTSANLMPSAPTWICSLLFLTVKPPLFRVLLPMVRPLSWLSPKVTLPSALLVATVRPFLPSSFKVLTWPLVPFLPTVMVSSSSAASSFLTVKVCRALLAVCVAALAAVSAASALFLASVASLALFSAALAAVWASFLALSAAFLAVWASLADVAAAVCAWVACSLAVLASLALFWAAVLAWVASLALFWAAVLALSAVDLAVSAVDLAVSAAVLASSAVVLAVSAVWLTVFR